MHSYEHGRRKEKGIWTWDEGEISDQSCRYKEQRNLQCLYAFCIGPTCIPIPKLGTPFDSTIFFRMGTTLGNKPSH